MATKKIVTKKRVVVKKTGQTKSVSREKSLARKPSGAGSVGKSERKKAAPIPEAVPLMIYRKIAITFVVIVAAALLVVLYLSTMQAVIKVSPVQTTLKTEFIAQTVGTPTTDTEIQGTVLAGTLGKTMTFTPTGDSLKEVDSVATGTVTIFNKGSFAQPLIKTTRLLRSDGVLFRLSKGVTVPAGGSVEAEIYSDEEGKANNIEVGTYTIPGLNEVKQKLVYAETTETHEVFTQGVTLTSAITQKELDDAAVVLEKELIQDGQSMLRAELAREYSGESFETKVLDKSFSIEPGVDAESFDVTLSVSFVGIFFDKEALEKITTAKLYQGLGQGQEFIRVPLEEMIVEVNKYSLDTKSANLLVKLEANAIASRTSKALDVSKFVGMNEDEVRKSLLDQEVATEVHVEFFPFWVRTVPRLKDHVYIEIR